MSSTGRVKSVSLFSLFVLAALPLAASAVAQPPVARTKPTIDQQLELNARHEKRTKQQHDGHSHRGQASAKRTQTQ